MRLLQRYILFELLRVFTFLLSALTILLVFVGVFREVSEFGLGPLEVLKILPFVVPSLMPFTIPATLLLTVSVVYGRISGDQEITAAKSAGINVMSLLWPSILLGIVASLGSLMLTDQAIPWAVKNIQRVVAQAMGDIFLDQLRVNHGVTDADRGYSISVMDVQGQRLIRPTFQWTPTGGNTATIQADEATLRFDLDQDQVFLHLVGGEINIGGTRRMLVNNDDYPFPLPFKAEDPKPRHLTIRELRKKSDQIREDLEQQVLWRDVTTAGALLTGDFDRLQDDSVTWFHRNDKFHVGKLSKLNTEIHSRFALSTSCLFFVLLGGPFAITQAKRQFLTSFFMCFLPILLIYYPVALLMLNLSKNSVVNPVWAVWIANGILLVVSLGVLRKVLQH